jgi:uncharacterized protein YutE (UPF0331/DUF86 family)
MSSLKRAVMERKLAFLKQFLTDLATYARGNLATRHREHYAIERLLQLLCESAADIGLQVLKAGGSPLASSYREVFTLLDQRGSLPTDLANALVDACAMRNLLTHLYDAIDLDRVAAAVEPALEIYGRYLDWAKMQVEELPE